MAHSLSPVIHRAALAASGLDGQYSLFDVPSAAGLDVYFAKLRAGELDGLNVTVPWKGEAAERCDALADDARVLGVTNTLVREGARVVGHNTDAAGLHAALVKRWPDIEARTVAVLGAGGAARAAALAAARAGAREVRVWNRTPSRAHDLARALAPALTPTFVKVLDDPADACRDADLVIQSGSGEMGLTGSAFDEAVIRATQVLRFCRGRLVDLVYKPRKTAWVAAADGLGLEADDGLAMLVMQAAAAFELWTGVRVSPEPLFAAVNAVL